MRYTIQVDTENAAFSPEPRHELARILRELADRVESYGAEYVPLTDVNGNRVGKADMLPRENQ